MATVEKHATYEVPGREGSPVELKPTYDNFIRGHWVAPTNGKHPDNVTPVTGEPFCQVAQYPAHAASAGTRSPASGARITR